MKDEIRQVETAIDNLLKRAIADERYAVLSKIARLNTAVEKIRKAAEPREKKKK